MSHEIRVNETLYRVTGTSRLLCSPLVENAELSLTVCGIERCTSDQSYDPTMRDDYHLHFVLSGKGILRIKEKSYSVQRGQMFLVPPDIEIHYYADKKDPWQYTWISFTGTKASYYLEKAGLSIDNPIRDCYIKPEDFLEKIEKILNYHELTITNELLRTSLLYEVVALLINSQNQNLIENHQPIDYDYAPGVYVDYALEYIRENYSHIRVSDIADYIGITRSYLTHIFKEKLQVSPQEYLLNYRLEQASRLLRTTNLSINEIAQKIGYANPLTFSKMFKQVYKLSPKNYRNQMLSTPKL